MRYLTKLVEVETILRGTLVNLEQTCLHNYVGYTHLQHAQPILWSPLDGLLQHVYDTERFEFNIKHTDISPHSGAAALCGTTFPNSRNMTSDLMGFP